MMKKTISILFCVVLILTLMVPALATESSNGPLTVNSVTAQVGDEVTLDVYMAETTFAAFGLQIVYDDQSLELVSITKGETLEEFMGFLASKKTGKVTAYHTENVKVEGVLFRITMKVLVAGEHRVELVVDSFNLADQTEVAVPNAVGVIHIHSYEAVVTEPTCGKKGFTTHICSCGDSYVTDETAAIGHDYKAVVTEPSCTEGGYTTYTCACGDQYTADETAALGHNFVDGKCACGATEASGGWLWIVIAGGVMVAAVVVVVILKRKKSN